jgi:hypothetical protein
MEIRHVARPHDRQEDEEVREAYPLHIPREQILSPLIFSALSLRLFGKDITTVGQQKAKNQIENQDRGHQAETPVEHAPMLDEDSESTPVMDDHYVPGETENSEI